jgi:hypothetical protein
MSPAEKLQSEGFTLEAHLRHDELVSFILPWLSLKHRVIRIFFAFNILFLLLLVAVIISFMLKPNGAIGAAFSHFAFGCALTILLIPIHEYIHGIAYRLCGADKVSYKANWKKMYFMAMADGFITGKKQFLMVGLAPFILISLILLFLATQFGLLIDIMLLSTLFIHAGMCAGDFALISFFDAAREREVVTYDDVVNQETFFYSRPKPLNLDSFNDRKI